MSEVRAAPDRLAMPADSLQLVDGQYVWRPNPLVIIISGPSGAGKDTVIGELRRQHGGLHFVVTATSRPMREHERHGVDYHFFSREEFLRRVDRGEFIEHADVYGQLKGVLRRELTDALDCGEDVVMRVDVQGARALRRLLPGAVLIFIMADSEAEQSRRLEDRGSEAEAARQQRLAEWRGELACLPEYDYVVINRAGALDDAVAALRSIIVAEKARVHQRQVVIS